MSGLEKSVFQESRLIALKKTGFTSFAFSQGMKLEFQVHLWFCTLGDVLCFFFFFGLSFTWRSTMKNKTKHKKTPPSFKVQNRDKQLKIFLEYYIFFTVKFYFLHGKEIKFYSKGHVLFCISPLSKPLFWTFLSEDHLFLLN